MNALPPVTDPSFRQKLREAREARNLSQYALAKLAGVALVMPRRYEDANDKYATLPTPATWAKLNAVLFPPGQQTTATASEQLPAAPEDGKADRRVLLESASIEEIVSELKRRGAASININWKNSFFYNRTTTMNAAKTAIEHAWNDILQLPPQHIFRTPTGSRPFSLVSVEQEQLTIATGSSEATIKKADFENTLAYLMDNGHNVHSPCLIASNKVYAQAGPLCQAARLTSRGRMNITYVLPILKEVGLVGIGSRRPSTSWFIY